MTEQMTDYKDQLTKISGTYNSLSDAERLTWPKAWNSVGDSERANREMAYVDVYNEVRELFEHPDMSVKSVTVERGIIVGYETYGDDETEY